MSVATTRPAGLIAKSDVHLVESDVYNIVGRIREIDERLMVVLQEGHAKPWVVMERGADGVERFVKRYSELDNRILDDLRYMLAVPLAERMKRVEREIDRDNAQLGRMGDESFERFAYDFRKAAVESNLVDPMWFTSYRKVTK